jgi:zinc transport system substrate-binding protein
MRKNENGICPEPQRKVLILNLSKDARWFCSSMLRALVLLIAVLFGVGRAMASPPEVVVSVKPIHSLVAAVMAGVATPGLIVTGGTSPHLYTLRPSDAERLASARIVFWIGPIFERFLTKPLAALAGQAEIVELDRAPEMTLLRAREGGPWEPHADEPAPPLANQHDAADEEMDGHLWLDPANAKAIAAIAAARLAAADPANAARYGANAAALSERLDALDARLDNRFEPLRHRPFVVFHDAYQYLTRRYDLAAVGSVAVSPERSPSARRIAAIHAKVAALKARCVFREPQFAPRLVDTVMAGTSARSAVLDPEGTELTPGPDLYFALMSKLADGLTRCLEQ